MTHSTRLLANAALLVASALILAAGLWTRYLGADALTWQLWLIGIVPNWLTLVITIVRSLMRRQVGVDVLAVISINSASLSGEVLVAAAVTLMLATRHALEDFAQTRAQRRMTASPGHAPKRVNRFADGQWHQVSLEKVQAGDRLLVRHDEIVPMDGTLSGPADLDEPMLIGEPFTRHRLMADAICSGMPNVGATFEMIASASAEKSTFAGAVRLASTAQSERSPSAGFVDRYASVLGGVAIPLVGASWILTGDSVRCLTMLVVTMPCPLIPAAPVAITSGLSRCTKRGALVKDGSALEQLVLADALFFDKIDTFTSEFARLVGVECASHYMSDVVLDLAGSVVQASNHVMAEAIAKATCEQDTKLRPLSGAVESPGVGVCGRIDGHVVSIGSLPYVLGSSAESSWVKVFAKRVSYAGASAVFVDVSGELVGALQLIDRVRLGAPRALRLLHRKGIRWQAISTRGRTDVTGSVGSMLRVTEVYAALSPTTKLAVIRTPAPTVR